MFDKLSRSLQKPLIELVSSYEKDQIIIGKHAKHEKIAKVAGFIGIVVTLFWIFEPRETSRFIGDLGLTMSFVAIVFGAWAWLSPPSSNPAGGLGPELYRIKLILKNLEELGFEPYIVDGKVSVKGSDNWIDPRDGDNFSISEQKDIPL